ncbi:MAG: small multi-drug export protein [DPANN group archaeon]|nr:small multi-drug export protein [DPANN group archaeon]
MADLMLYFIVIGLAMAPISEARGAILFGIAAGLSPWIVLPLSLAGNILAIPVVFWVLRQAHLREFIFKIFHKTADSHIQKNKNKFELYKELALFAFVAMPLPVTGGYTGTLISEVLGWDWKKSFVAIAAGIIVAGVLVFLGANGIIKLFSI